MQPPADLHQVKVPRRAVLRLIGLGAAGSVLAACSPAPTAGTGPAGNVTPPAGTSITVTAPGQPAPAAAQPRSGGTLRQGALGDLADLDGHQITGDHTIYPIWERLVDLDANLQPVPLLAESWDVNSDFTQIKFNLRRGVQWHTGRELTSEDVVWNYNRIKTDPKIDGGAMINLYAPLTSMETPDKYTLITKSDKPWPGSFSMFAFMNLIDPVTFDAPGGGVMKPVGTGPFTFVEWVQGDHFTLKKNPRYWQSGKPYLDTIEIKIFTDPQAMVAQLQAGVLDMINNPPYTAIVDLQKDPKFKIVLNKQTGSSSILMAQSKDPSAPTGSKMLRQAVNWAIDRQRIVDTVYLGLGEPRNLPFPSGHPAYDAERNRHYTYNLDQAKAALAQSGLTDPSVEFAYSAVVPELASIAQIVQADLAKIGVRVTLRPMEAVAASRAQQQSTFPGLFGGGILLGQLHPGVMTGNPYYSAGFNWAGFRSEELATLSQAMLLETDPSRAKEAYAAWEDYVLDQSFSMPISAAYGRVATLAKVSDVRFNGSGDWITTNDAWLSA